MKDAVDYGVNLWDMMGILWIDVKEISRKKDHIYDAQIYDLIEK